MSKRYPKKMSFSAIPHFHSSHFCLTQQRVALKALRVVSRVFSERHRIDRHFIHYLCLRFAAAILRCGGGINYSVSGSGWMRDVFRVIELSLIYSAGIVSLLSPGRLI